MFNLQGSEIIIILLLALVFLGPEKLPGSAIRKFAKTYAELRKMGTGFQTEFKKAMDEPFREMKETANLLRDAADPNKLIRDAEAEERARQAADATHATDTMSAAVEASGAGAIANGQDGDVAADDAEPAPRVRQTTIDDSDAALVDEQITPVESGDTEVDS